MRRTDVAGDLEVRTQVLQARLGQLVTLFDDTDRLKGQIQSLRGSQDGDVWPGIPSVAAFAENWRAALQDVERRLDALRNAIEGCRQALSDTGLSFEQQDAAVQEQFRLLAERLDTTSAPTGGRGL